MQRPNIRAASPLLEDDRDEILGTGDDDLLIGSDRAEQRIFGLGGNDTIEGRGGRDWIFGGPGSDTLLGGDGNDVLQGGRRSAMSEVDHDVLAGGAGIDRADYGDAIGPVTVNLWFGYAQYGDSGGTDVLDSIEEVQGGPGGDNLFGDACANTLLGGAGNDNLEGYAGDDVLYGEDGNDYLFGDFFFAAPGNDRLYGGAGNDRIQDHGGNDIVDAGAGNDIVEAGSGDDVLDGGAGTDVVVFFQGRFTAGPFRLDLAIGTPQDTGDGCKTVRGFEYVSASAASKAALWGTAGTNQIIGSRGDDWLVGRGGIDDLYGGEGRDRFVYCRTTDAPIGLPPPDPSDDPRGNPEPIGPLERISFFVAGEDRIVLTRIDADQTRAGDQAFRFIAEREFSGRAGELRFDHPGSGSGVVSGDVTGDGIADFAIALRFLTGTISVSSFDL